jgi:hypothetical protein
MMKSAQSLEMKEGKGRILWWMMLCLISSLLEPSNGERPVTSSKMVTPRLQMSTFSFTPGMSSGRMVPFITSSLLGSLSTCAGRRGRGREALGAAGGREGRPCQHL